jgi:putative membrane protein
MHTGKSYKLSEFLVWTRRNIYLTLIIGCVPTILYQVFDLKWLAIPWTVVALLGTATAFIVGFKNTQTYNRTWEARQIWGGVLTNSRGWGMMCRDYLNDPAKTKELVYRHFAWLTVLRYTLRDSRAWETTGKLHNKEYQKFYSIPEKETPLEAELAKYISSEEIQYILGTKNRALQLISLQGKAVKELYEQGQIDLYRFIEMENALKDIIEQQGKSERIKNFPYPRQFASINAFFVRLFCLLLPFGLLKEFDKLNEGMTGLFAGHMVWFVVPFSVLISWVYTSLEQVGESTENPFEGSSNDVPISQMSRNVEIDLREMLGETDLPEALQAKNNIIL